MLARNERAWLTDLSKSATVPTASGSLQGHPSRHAPWRASAVALVSFAPRLRLAP